MVKVSPFRARGDSSIPDWEAKIPHSLWPKNQNIKYKQHCNKFKKDFKDDQHPKKKNQTLKKESDLWEKKKFFL